MRHCGSRKTEAQDGSLPGHNGPTHSPPCDHYRDDVDDDDDEDDDDVLANILLSLFLSPKAIAYMF